MAFSNALGKPVLMAMVHAIQKNKDYLGEIDGLIGDGDHGMNMNKGFTMFGDRLVGETTLSDGLEGLGMLLLSEIGGSMGPIYGTLFMSMADSIAEADEIGPKELAKAFREGYDALCEIVDARVGDKTLMDTLTPVVEAASRLADTNAELDAVLNRIKAEAAKGCESTVDMVAKFGRSSRLGERSRGVPDAGATSCKILIEAMADAMLAEL